jgi:hypothetical protein
MSITLSQGVPEWFVDQFKNTLYHVCQQENSKFGQAVRDESVVGAEDKAFDMIDEFSLVPKESANPQTPILDISSQRRWVTPTPFHNAVLKDKDEDLSMILDPASDYVQNFRKAVNRKKDDIILASFDGDVASGRRKGSTITWASQNGNVKYTDASGGRTIPWDCSEGNCDAADSGMTVEKIELVKEYFAFNDCDEDTPIWGALSPRQATNLFGQNEYVNVDFNTSKPLATGRIIRNWHGINWIVSTKIVRGTNNDVDGDKNVFRCPFWMEDGIILGTHDEMTVEMSIRDDLSYAQQIYVHMSMGAFRQDEDRVVYVEAF